MFSTRFLSRIKSWALLQAIRFFRIRDRSEPVARGFSVGLIVNFFPTFGFGVLFSGLLARLIGGNSVAGLVGGAALTFAWPALFYLNYWCGDALINGLLGCVLTSGSQPGVIGNGGVGQAFMAGAVANSLLVGMGVYWLVRFGHGRVRPSALQWLCEHLRAHQGQRKAPRKAGPSEAR